MGWSLYIYGRDGDQGPFSYGGTRLLLAEFSRNSQAYMFLDQDDDILHGAFDKFKVVSTDEIGRVINKLEIEILEYRLNNPYPITNQNKEQTEWFEEYNDLVELLGQLRIVARRCYDFVWFGNS